MIINIATIASYVYLSAKTIQYFSETFIQTDLLLWVLLALTVVI